MTPQSFPYPVTPANVPLAVTEPSPAFKTKVSKVMGSIVLFFIVYILLVLLAIGLAIASVYGGIALILAIPRIITVLVGIGLIGLGVMVFFFLVKFIFAVSRFDRSGSIEIKEKDHPKLFAFIRRLTRDTQTPFPKRVYLSPEVNACVFYDSGFWSMLLPVKKNLQIGLGLVNSLNLGEFKAVMAHEFGHFSQRSMKLGSFVYNVNRVIYNMLFENTGYGRFLENWANVSSYFAFFATLTVRIVNGIQWVLQQMYGLINKNYMGLSREMEFHADAVAASVSGSQNCINALRRIELADSCFNEVIRKCNEWLKQKYTINNIYLNQQTVFKQYAGEFNLQLNNNLPVVTREAAQNQQFNRVNFKDQWASHPTMEEREAHLEKLDVKADIDDESAWVLFEQVTDWQQKLTDKLYEKVELPADGEVLDKAGFDKKFGQEIELYTLPAVYNGFYTGREIALLDIVILSAATTTETAQDDKLESIFSNEHASLPKKIKGVEADLALLKSIADRKSGIETFDFDGEKYAREKAEEFIDELEKALKGFQQEQEELDKRAYRFFYSKALQQDSSRAFRLKEAYTEYFKYRKAADQYLADINKMLNILQPLFSGQQLTVDSINYMISDLKNGPEEKFKKDLQFWIDQKVFDSEHELKVKAIKFIDSIYTYFNGTTFFSEEFSVLNELANESWRLVTVFLFKKFKAVLLLQLELAGVGSR